MKSKWLVAASVSAVLGLIHVMAMGYVWNHLVLVNPIPHWLIVHGAKGNTWRGLIVVQDVIINTVLCLPLACVLRLLRPRHPWAYLATALLAGEAWVYRAIFNPLPQGVGLGAFVPGLLMTIVAFAIAGWAVGALARARHAAL